MTTDFLTCIVGDRQGEIYHHFFALYINDLDMFFFFFFTKKDIVDLDCISKVIEEELLNFLKLSILLYADETVIMAEYAYDLQHALNEFEVCCKQWKC